VTTLKRVERIAVTPVRPYPLPDLRRLAPLPHLATPLPAAYTFLVTFPACKQDVQTRMRLGVPFTSARTFCKLGNQRRFVTLWAWDML